MIVWLFCNLFDCETLKASCIYNNLDLFVKSPPSLQIKMRWQHAILALGLVASVASAETFEEDGDARLGYISVGSSGATSITFNATSIQNAVILGLFTLVLGALILPLFGVSLGSLFGGDSSDSGYSYGFDQAENSNYGYETSGNAYNSFSKR